MHIVTKTIIVMDLHEMEGLFVGSLNVEELKLFQAAVDAGKARRSYEGGSGFMGLAKVRLVKSGNA